MSSSESNESIEAALKAENLELQKEILRLKKRILELEEELLRNKIPGKVRSTTFNL